jgi:hypothetical protein
MFIQGSCHCGNIRFKLNWQPEPSEIPARTCGCTFCQKHGGVWTSCPTGSVAVEVADPSRVNHYAFGTKTATFHVCSLCGAVPIVTSTIDAKTYAVVNVNTLEGLDPTLLKRSASNFDGEDEAARLARRARGWIPDVRFDRRSDS